jgi:hypothetical protein
MDRFVVALLAWFLLCVPAAHARNTQRCNTTDTNEYYFFGMSAQTQERLLAVIDDPSIDPDLYERLWRPTGAQATTTALASRFVIVDLDPMQDVAEVVAAIRADPLMQSLGIESVDVNARGIDFIPPPPAFQRVTEFRNAVTGHYFLSSSEEENAILDAGGAGEGWQRTGESFLTVPPMFSPYQSLAVFRFYGPGPNSHFFTADVDECAGLRNPASGWIAEGIAFGGRAAVDGQCPPPPFGVQYTPVYRLYNNRWMFGDSNHRYTIKPEIYLQMITQGWVGEGVAICIRNGS